MSAPTGRPVTFTGFGGITLAGEQWGNADGPLVLLLHGGGQTRHSWKSTGAQLAASGARVIALDARGHGDSEWSAERDYRREAMARDVVAVLDELGEPAVIVGASMGGLCGLYVSTLVGPELLSALVLVDVVPRPEEVGAPASSVSSPVTARASPRWTRQVTPLPPICRIGRNRGAPKAYVATFVSVAADGSGIGTPACSTVSRTTRPM